MTNEELFLKFADHDGINLDKRLKVLAHDLIVEHSLCGLEVHDGFEKYVVEALLRGVDIEYNRILKLKKVLRGS